MARYVIMSKKIGLTHVCTLIQAWLYSSGETLSVVFECEEMLKRTRCGLLSQFRGCECVDYLHIVGISNTIELDLQELHHEIR